jgi:23S rRNA G2445 N2-methylase RlmL
MISPSNDKHPPRFMAAKNRKYITRSPKKKKITKINIDDQGPSYQIHITLKNEVKVTVKQTIFQL